jgi:hypothetical protein
VTSRPAFTAEQAVARALSLVGKGGRYELGTGDYRPQPNHDGTIDDLPWTSNGGPLGSDCVGFAINWCYGIRRHRPGFNHRSAGDFDVEDDINCNSAIGDADTDRDLFERVYTPAPGVLLTYPTIHLPGHPPFCGHVGIVTSVARCAEWDATAPNYELLDVAQCCGPNGRAPAVIATDGAVWASHDRLWPKPQHRTVMLRVLP